MELIHHPMDHSQIEHVQISTIAISNNMLIRVSKGYWEPLEYIISWEMPEMR